MPDLGDHTRAFLHKECDSLRNQIQDRTRELLSLERWTLIVSGFVWSWLASRTGGGLPGLIYWSPAIISVLFGLRAFGLHLSNLRAGKYIARIERANGLTGEYGWENSLNQRRPFLIRFSSYAYWILLTGINVAIPCVYIPYLRSI